MCLKVYIAHVSLECVDSELVITLSVPFSDEAAARTAPADMRAFVDAEQGEPHDSALFGFQELLHSFRVTDWSVFGAVIRTRLVRLCEIPPKRRDGRGTRRSAGDKARAVRARYG